MLDHNLRKQKEGNEIVKKRYTKAVEKKELALQQAMKEKQQILK